MVRRFVFIFSVAAAFANGACGAGGRRPAGPAFAVHDDDAPPSRAQYGTESSQSGVFGGASARAMAAAVVDIVRQRGEAPREDERLGELAGWIARAYARHASIDPPLVDAMSRRLGYVGPVPHIIASRGDDEDAAKESLRKHITALPSNINLTRYGIAYLRTGDDRIVVTALGDLELALQPFPKRLTPGSSVVLRGSLGERFHRARLAMTMPDGTVTERAIAGRSVSEVIEFTQQGTHRVELFGEGAAGPVIVANMPVYVGVDEPPVVVRSLPREAAPSLEPDVIHARMFALLAAARNDAHVRPLAEDPALARCAQAHSDDMATAGFVGHVSPNTGTFDDRMKRAHLVMPKGGENVALSDSAEHAHQQLMDSPGHRGAMLDADFTHVGIGITVREERVYATLVFAKKAGITLATAAREVAKALARGRQQRGLAALNEDDAAMRAAQAAAVVLSSQPDAMPRAMEAAKASLVRDKKANLATCVGLVTTSDASRFELPPAAESPNAVILGLAAMPDPDGPETFRILLIMQAKPHMPLVCE